jgi:hypothetical protein
MRTWLFSYFRSLYWETLSSVCNELLQRRAGHFSRVRLAIRELLEEGLFRYEYCYTLGTCDRVPGLRIELDDHGTLLYFQVYSYRKLRGYTELTQLADTSKIFGNAMVWVLVTEGRTPIVGGDISIEYSGIVMKHALQPFY